MKLFLILFALPLAAHADEFLDRLNTLPGVLAKETTKPEDQAKTYRRFAITIEQSVDHFDPKSLSFKQRLVLFHKGENEPMVLQTSGYGIFGERLSQLATTFGANQLQVEHRHFAESLPNPAQWEKLTVRQSAEDFHRVVQVFKSVYGARWINTGSSKGGMTSIFHRRFYPQDLDGTLANVAPIDFGLEDPRYITFVDNVGGEKYAECRAALEKLQILLLRKREEILPKVEGKFEKMNKEVAYEISVVEMPFIFWQYKNPEDEKVGCAHIPGEASSEDELLTFLNAVNSPEDNGDSGLEIFGPYYYQSANELGYPGAKLSHLEGLLKHPYSISAFLPPDEHPVFDPAPMRDIQSWVAREGKGMMLVYGQFDPWSAGALRELNPNGDNFFFELPGNNHKANIMQLGDTERAGAVATLARWIGKSPVVSPFLRAAVSVRDDSLEALERRVLSRER